MFRVSGKSQIVYLRKGTKVIPKNKIKTKNIKHIPIKKNTTKKLK